MKSKRMAGAVVLALIMGLALAAMAEQAAAPAVANPQACIDKQLCADNLRFGQESFGRGLYGQAKQYFKQAVVADPTSAAAWSYYDLCVMYDVAEQVKKAGRVVSTDAAAPAAPAPAGESAAAPAAPAAPPAPAAPAAPAEPSGGMTIGHDEGC